MKTVTALVLLCSSIAFAGPQLKGTYGLREADGTVNTVARIFERHDSLFVKFVNACTAPLKLTARGIEGYCTHGRGYDEAAYEAQVVIRNGAPVLRYRIKEFSDLFTEEMDFVDLTKI